jgi:L-ascorbate metabolism protein UlaG (beta-lactamase superfamily)
MKTRYVRFLLTLGLALGALGPFEKLAAQVTPEFTVIQPLTNREIRLQLSAPAGQNYRIDASTNLPAWSPLITLTGVTTTLQHTDSAAPYLRTRYYRAEQLTGTNILTGDYLNTTNGDVLIKPINHAAFVLRWQDKMIYNDPGNTASRFNGLQKADLILISHSHGDHFNTGVIDSVRNATAPILVPQDVYNRLTTPQKAVAVVLGYGASANILGITVEAVPATNSNHQPGLGNGYIMNIGDKRIYASGDTGNIPPLRVLPNIDVAFVAMNLPFTMDATAAADLVRAMRPKVVYPYHYSPSTPTADLGLFKRLVGSDLGIEVRLRAWY